MTSMGGQDSTKMRIFYFLWKTKKLQVQKKYRDLFVSYSDHIGERKCDEIVTKFLTEFLRKFNFEKKIAVGGVDADENDPAKLSPICSFSLQGNAVFRK